MKMEEEPISIQETHKNEMVTTFSTPQFLRSNQDFRQVAFTIYTVQIQLNKIAGHRSSLEDGYLELIKHDSPSVEDFQEIYLEARTILKENPKLLFDETEEGKIARQVIDNAQEQLRNILLRERKQWAEAAAFERGIKRLNDETTELYKEMATKGWEIRDELKEKYHRARDILSLPIIVLKADETTQDLELVRQVITELQIVIQNERQKEKEKQAEEERKLEQGKKEKEDVRRLLTFMGIYMVIPVSLFSFGLGYLILRYGTVSSYFNIQLPFLGVPYSVLLWSALGSIASMLHFVNKYAEDYFQTPWKMFRWAVTRPLIGIIMGTVVYLAITGGILVTNSDYSPTNFALLWLFAFIGGFSDQMQQAVINLIVGKTPLHLNNNPPSKVEESK